MTARQKGTLAAERGGATPERPAGQPAQRGMRVPVCDRLRPAARLFLAAVAVVPAGLVAGCTGEGAPRIRFVVDVADDVLSGEGIDTIEVTLTASRTSGFPALALCEPVSCRFPTGGGAALPLIVDFYRGATYRALALFRVVWWAGSVPVAVREVAIPWPDSGARRFQVTLERPCLGVSCAPGSHCWIEAGEPACISFPFPGAFTDRSLVDQGVPCGRDDAPASCPELDGGTEPGTDVPEDHADVSDVPAPCQSLEGPCPQGMAWVPGGVFIRGSDPNEGFPDETPEHIVEVSGFCIDQMEVTNSRYLSCMRAGACTEPSGGPHSWGRAGYLYSSDYADYPVVNVEWGQAAAFCQWEGKRLPTEAEWEKACRGGCEDPSGCHEADERTYPWGEAEATCDLANYNRCLMRDGLDNDTDRVGARPAGAQPDYCIFDLGGNVDEWVSDWYATDTYARCAEQPGGCTDPSGPAEGSGRIVRGGSFFDAGLGLRCARRRRVGVSEAAHARIGFRCALSVPTSP